MIFVTAAPEAGVGAGPRHRALPAFEQARLPRRQPPRGMSESPLLAEFHELASARSTRSRRARPGLGAARLTRCSPTSCRGARRIGAAAGTRRSALLSGRPNVGKSTLSIPGSARERLIAFGPAGHDARRSARALRAQRPALRADRHGRIAPQGSRQSRSRRRCRRSSRPTSCCCCLDATQGDRPGRAHRRPHPRWRAVVAAVNKGTPSTPTSEMLQRLIEQRLAFLAKFAPVATIRRSGAKGWPRSGSIAEAYASAVKDADAGADAPAAGGGMPQAPSAPEFSCPACGYGTRGHEAADHVIHGNR